MTLLSERRRLFNQEPYEAVFLTGLLTMYCYEGGEEEGEDDDDISWSFLDSNLPLEIPRLDSVKGVGPPHGIYHARSAQAVQATKQALQEAAWDSAVRQLLATRAVNWVAHPPPAPSGSALEIYR